MNADNAPGWILVLIAGAFVFVRYILPLIKPTPAQPTIALTNSASNGSGTPVPGCVAATSHTEKMAEVVAGVRVIGADTRSLSESSRNHGVALDRLADSLSNIAHLSATSVDQTAKIVSILDRQTEILGRVDARTERMDRDLSHGTSSDPDLRRAPG